MNKLDTINVVLDIDGTLVDARTVGNPPYLDINIRPHMKDFLIFLTMHCTTVSIFTAGTTEYAKEIAKMLTKIYRGIRIKWIFSRDNMDVTRVSLSEVMFHKNLSVLWNRHDAKRLNVNRRNTFLIDDEPQNFYAHQENGILIKSYKREDEKTDTELIRVMDILERKLGTFHYILI